MPWSIPEGGVLAVFGSQPLPGRVAPRLAAGLGDEAAALVHEAMLFDTLDAWSSEANVGPGGRRVLAFAPGDAGPWFDARVPEPFALQPQEGDDPGRALRAFFEGEFADGAQKVVVIGSDAPTLDPSAVVTAFLCLDTRDVVVGPASTGGFTLVGARFAAPPIFEAIDWGAPDVLAQLIDRLNATGLSLAVLPPALAVDGADAWRALAGQVRAMRRAGLSPGLPRVEAAIGQTLPRRPG